MDSRPLTAILKALADSPVPLAEVYFTPDGQVSRVVLAGVTPANPAAAAPKKLDSPPPPRRLSAVHSLREVGPQMSSTPEPNAD